MHPTVEELIGRDTVNTLPPKTIDAFRDHGEARESLTESVAEAQAHIASLADIGIDFDEVTTQLQREGVEKFVRPFDQLLETLERKREALAEGVSA